MSKIGKDTRRIKTEVCPTQLKQSISHAKYNLPLAFNKLQEKPLPKHDRHKTEAKASRLRFQEPHRILLISTRHPKTQSTNSQTLKQEANNQQEMEYSPKYDLQSIAGKGGFGVVYRAKCPSNCQTVAIKKVLQNKQFKSRELTLLKQLGHSNIINLRDHYFKVQHDREYLFLVMDYYSNDLASLIKRKTMIKEMLPVYLLQILRGLQYLNEKGVAHRDLKPQNILIDIVSHIAVICDFGSAKQLIYGQSNISYICARGYRAPELIFGSKFYSTAVDMWSFGCIAIEIINSVSLFQGRSNIEQMIAIMEILGTPSEEEMAAMNPFFNRKEYDIMPKVKGRNWKDVLLTSNKVLIDLISRIMVYSPDQRYNPTDTINHPFFNCLRNQSYISYLEGKYGPLPFLTESEFKPRQPITTPMLNRKNENLKTMTTISEFQTAQSSNHRNNHTPRNLNNLAVHLHHPISQLF